MITYEWRVIKEGDQHLDIRNQMIAEGWIHACTLGTTYCMKREVNK